MNSKSAVKTKNVLTEIKGSAIFLGPTMLLFTLLFLIPLVSEIFYSFTNWNGIDPTFKFIGLKNYLRTVKDATYWTSFWFTIKFSIFVVVISNLIGFFWAYVLSGDIPYKNGRVDNSIVDVSRFCDDTGFKARTSFDEGILKTVEYYRGLI